MEGVFGGEFGEVCKQHCINQEFTNIDSPKTERCGREGVRYHPSARHISPALNYRLLNPCGLKRCTGLVTPSITLRLLQTRKEVTARIVVLKCRNVFATLVPSTGALSLEMPVEVAPPGRELLSPRAGHRPPN